jgi:Flp pilus assembly protein TadD
MTRTGAAMTAAQPGSVATNPQTIADLLSDGLNHHRAGRDQDAAKIYNQVLQHDADQPYALHLLGEIAHRAGENEQAARLIERAVAVLPRNAEAHNNLGAAYQALGRLDDAETSYRRAIALKPALSVARSNLGSVLTAQGRRDEARVELEKALSIDPNASEARLNLGNLHRDGGALAEAEACYRTVAQREPNNAAAWNNLGSALLALGRHDEAKSALERATALNPGSVEAHRNLGIALRRLGQRPAAIEALRTVFRLEPSALAQNMIGSALIDAEDLAGAEHAFAEAVRIDPHFADAHANLGSLLRNRGDLAGAIASYRRALACDPDNAVAHNNLGGALLLSEDWAEGWAEFEWRWRLGDNPALRARHRLPLWQGDSLRGRHILLWGEQGIGDVVLFATMLPDLLATGAQVSLELDPRLVATFRRSFPAATVYAWDSVPASAQFDCQANLGRLGLFLRTSAKAFATTKPYLRPDPARVAAFRRRYATLGAGPKIGIAWRSASAVHPRKSLILDEFAPLFAALPDATYVSLQYGDTAEELGRARAKYGASILHDDSFDNWSDLDGLAAQIASLDHVVTVSNINAHLAGAQGIPTDVVVAANVLWYWPHAKPCTAWYPSLRLHHAGEPGSRGRLFGDLAGRLAKRD